MKPFTLIFLLLLLTAGCSRQDSFKGVKSTDLSGETIADLRLDQIIDGDFRKDFGELKDLQNAVYDYYELKNGIVIASKNNKIIRIILSSEEYETMKGIKIGNTINDLKKIYGENFYKREEQGTKIIGYYDKKSNATIEFWTYDEKITQIRLDKDFVE
ncbi:hypothetical protein [Paenibacillus sp.]|jgi:hypothetical protein|uniref:hypothetical protein n=1 Tax=Paenibacillus sp. TaxID=58172 RepID=UPI002830F866|nr:hypothetical protein [Paenibacillus sp.]MDR0271138.1 hypothetical protein [Paenibacillus sp.]